MTSRDGDRMLPEIVREALSRIKILLDTLFEASEDAIFLMDGTRFVDCNPATLRIYGCKTKRDILGETPARFSADRQPDGAPSDEKSRALVAAAMAGFPQHFEWRQCRLDLTEFDTEVNLNRCFVEGARFVVAVVRDITARKRAEAELRQEKQFSDALIDSLPGTFYLFDSELRLRRWNKYYERESGYTPEELRGKRLEDWPASEADRRRVLAVVRRVMEHGGRIEVLETELRNRDGSVDPYLVSGSSTTSSTCRASCAASSPSSAPRSSSTSSSPPPPTPAAPTPSAPGSPSRPAPSRRSGSTPTPRASSRSS